MTEEPTLGRHADQLLEERVDDEVIVYNRATDAYYTLNPTATAVWDLVDGNRSFEALVTALSEQFAIEPAEIRDDVASIVAEFTEAGLLVV